MKPKWIPLPLTQPFDITRPNDPWGHCPQREAMIPRQRLAVHFVSQEDLRVATECLTDGDERVWSMNPLIFLSLVKL